MATTTSKHQDQLNGSFHLVISIAGSARNMTEGHSRAETVAGVIAPQRSVQIIFCNPYSKVSAPQALLPPVGKAGTFRFSLGRPVPFHVPFRLDSLTERRRGAYPPVLLLVKELVIFLSSHAPSSLIIMSFSPSHSQPAELVSPVDTCF